MFDNLQDRLGSILNGLTGRGALSDKDVSMALREVRRALLEADVALEVDPVANSFAGFRSICKDLNIRVFAGITQSVVSVKHCCTEFVADVLFWIEFRC